jgi:glutathione S-transferase
MLTLYFAPGSSSMAPHIALHEIGVTFERRPVSLANKETWTPAFLAINPAAKVPVLLVDGRPLTEVAGILFYLARRYPQAGLLPANDVEMQAQAVSWMSFIASSLHPARRQGIEHARSVYGIADQLLGEREWALGRYSIADIHLFRLFWRFRNWLNIVPGELPHLSAHYERMISRGRRCSGRWRSRRLSVTSCRREWGNGSASSATGCGVYKIGERGREWRRIFSSSDGWLIPHASLSSHILLGRSAVVGDRCGSTPLPPAPSRKGRGRSFLRSRPPWPLV